MRPIGRRDEKINVFWCREEQIETIGRIFSASLRGIAKTRKSRAPVDVAGDIQQGNRLAGFPRSSWPLEGVEPSLLGAAISPPQGKKVATNYIQ